MKVTGINPFTKNHCLVHLDNEQHLLLSHEDRDKFQIDEGVEISDEVYNFILDEILTPNAKNKALNYLTYRARTIKEMKKYLKDKGFNDIIIERTISFLCEYNFLNDYRFAKSFIENKMNSKPFGRRGIYYNLNEKGIHSDIISEVLESLDFDEVQCCVSMINKRLKGNNLSDKETNRLYGYLQRRGFSYSSIKKAISIYKNEQNSFF